MCYTVRSVKFRRQLNPEIRDLFSDFCFSQFCDIIFLWSHLGLPLARSSGLNTRKEGFDSPWLHIKKLCIKQGFLIEATYSKYSLTNKLTFKLPNNLFQLLLIGYIPIFSNPIQNIPIFFFYEFQ